MGAGLVAAALLSVAAAAGCATPRTGNGEDRDLAGGAGVDLAGRDLAGLDFAGVDFAGTALDLRPPRTGVAATGTWTQIDSPADALPGGAVDSGQPRLSVYQDRPVLAWSESGQIRVATWNGTWTVLGDALGSGTPAAYSPQIDGRNDRLHVGFIQVPAGGGQYYSMYVHRWTGSAWVAVGAPVSQGLTYLPDLALVVDSTGHPIISWTSQIGGTGGHSEIVSQRYDDTSWVPFGAGLHAESATSSAISAHTAIDAADQITSAWQETFVHVWRGNASGFSALGPSDGKLAVGDTTTSSFETRLTVDGQGRPVVSWMEWDGTSSPIHVVRWNGSGWVSLISTPVSAVAGFTNSANATITTDGIDTPFVVWTEPDSSAGSAVTRLYVARIAGGTWTVIGQPLALPTGFRYLGSATIAIDGNDVPMVAFSGQRETDSKYRLFVYRYL